VTVSANGRWWNCAAAGFSKALLHSRDSSVPSLETAGSATRQCPLDALQRIELTIAARIGRLAIHHVVGVLVGVRYQPVPRT
jgi:hypothetical protein